MDSSAVPAKRRFIRQQRRFLLLAWVLLCLVSSFLMLPSKNRCEELPLGTLFLVEVPRREHNFPHYIITYSLRTGKREQILRMARGQQRNLFGFSFAVPDRIQWIVDPSKKGGPSFVDFSPKSGLREKEVVRPSDGVRSYAFGHTPNSPCRESGVMAFLSGYGVLLVKAEKGNWVTPDGQFFRFSVGKISLWDMTRKAIMRDTGVSALDINGACGETHAWSPDGSTLLFTSCADPRWLQQDELDKLYLKDWNDLIAKRPAALFVYDYRAAEAGYLCEGWTGRWSPKGDRVAVLGACANGRCELSVVDRHGREPRRVLLQSDWSIGDFCWSPDGKFICYLGQPEPDISRSIEAYMFGWGLYTGVWVTDLQGTFKRRLFSGDFKHVFWGVE